MTAKMSGKKERVSASDKLSLVQAGKYTAKTKVKSNTGAKVKKQEKAVKSGVAPNERLQMIAEAAYFRAEQRGFDPEKQIDDWLEAETIVDAVLSESKHGHSNVPH
jgi:hypothetical protein